MRPPRLTGLVIAALVVPLVSFGQARGQEKGVPSDATAIPMPPPAPPPRPPELANPEPAKPGSAKPDTGKSESGKSEPNPIAAPRPPERPADLGGASQTAGPSPGAEAVKPTEAGETPVPPPRPPELAGAALAITVTPLDDGACRRRLERLGARFTPLPAIADGQCGAGKPLRVTALADDVTLTPPVTLVCEAAEALARWATEVQAAAERDLGQALTGLTIGTSYACRGQNHDPDAKLSEHSFANGVDVMGFTFAKRPSLGVTPLPDESPEARFLTAVRSRACGFFRTVLGPGSDTAHANHLHLDERERSAGHRLCQ